MYDVTSVGFGLSNSYAEALMSHKTALAYSCIVRFKGCQLSMRHSGNRPSRWLGHIPAMPEPMNGCDASVDPPEG
jgi:hypothetical protein